jgi:hypothetical protein
VSKRSLIIASVVGVAFAIGGSALIRWSIGDATKGLVVLLLYLIAAAIAGRAILGGVRTHRYFRLVVPLLSAISAAAFATATSDWFIGRNSHLGGPRILTSGFWIAVVVGAAAYLIAATAYGFAGTRQGVRVGSRIGLLLVLLLAVLPYLDVLGLIGFVLIAALRKPAAPAPSAIPAPPAASA